MRRLDSHIFAIRIAGIGADETTPVADSEGYLWCTPGLLQDTDRAVSAPSDLSGTPTYRVAIDPADVSMSGTTVEPYTASSTYSGLDITLMSRRDVAPDLMTTESEFAALVDAAIAPGDGTITLDRTDLEGEVVYIDNETITLNTHTGGGTYSVGRGIYGSQAAHHRPGTYVWAGVPFIGGRTVEAWVGYPVAASAGDVDAVPMTWSRRWIGTMVGGIDQEDGVVRVELDETLAAFGSTERGRGDRSFDGSFYATYESRTDGGKRLVLKDPISPDTPSAIYKDDDIRAIEIDDVAYQKDPTTSGRSIPLWQSIDDKSVKDVSQGRPPSITEDHEPYEILAYRRNAPAGSLDAGFHPLSLFIQGGLPEYYDDHPLSWYAAFHFSTPADSVDRSQFDIFEPEWSLNALDLYGDGIIQRIKDLIDETRGRQIDQVALGDGGDAFDLRSWARQSLLRAFGFYEAPRDDGSLWIYQAPIIDVDAYEQAQGNKISPVPETIVQRDGQGESVGGLTVCVGDHAYSQQSVKARLSTLGDGQSRREALEAADAKPLDVPTISRESFPQYRTKVISQVVLQSLRIPRVIAYVRDLEATGGNYDIGSPVALDALNIDPEWLVSRAGERVDPDSSVEWTGIIQGRAYEPIRGRYKLTILLVATGLVRLRAPTAVIGADSARGDSIFEVEATSFGDPQGDASRFTVGDTVEVLDHTFAPVDDTSYEITDISVEYVTVTPTHIQGYSAGHQLELTDYGDERPDGLGGEYSHVDRVYTYMADTDETLGDDDDTADTYGT